jgi:hypothetical protein
LPVNTKEQEQEAKLLVQETNNNRIYQVTDGLRSKHTKEANRIAFEQFLREGGKNDLQVLLDRKPKILEQLIIGHIENLRIKGRAHGTIALHTAGDFA